MTTIQQKTRPRTHLESIQTPRIRARAYPGDPCCFGGMKCQMDSIEEADGVYLTSIC